MEIVKNDNKIIRHWCLYDWANSVYSLVITTAIFPPYYEYVTSLSGSTDMVSFFGFEIVNSVLYSYSLSFSFLLVALMMPLLSGIADYSGKKKLFLRLFMIVGSVSCMGLYFFDGANIEWGIICSIMASIGYSGSLVFYDAFLPEIATPDRYDQISAKGYSYGYIGSVILLVFNIFMIQMPEIFGFEEGSIVPTKLSFVLVGIWWIVFSQISLSGLPKGKRGDEGSVNFLSQGYREFLNVYNEVMKNVNIKRYLLAFLFFNMGVQTVMYLASLFGSKELKLETSELILVVLIIQLVAIPGAYLFSYISKVRGNKTSLLVLIGIWLCVCVDAYFVQSSTEFYILAFVVGLIMGGSQSMSRSTYTKLIPTDTELVTSYFSFYDIVFVLSMGLGTFVFGFVNFLTGSMRTSVLALLVFFVIGAVGLLRVRIPFSKA